MDWWAIVIVLGLFALAWLALTIADSLMPPGGRVN